MGISLIPPRKHDKLTSRATEEFVVFVPNLGRMHSERDIYTPNPCYFLFYISSFFVLNTFSLALLTVLLSNLVSSSLLTLSLLSAILDFLQGSKSA